MTVVVLSRITTHRVVLLVELPVCRCLALSSAGGMNGHTTRDVIEAEARKWLSRLSTLGEGEVWLEKCLAAPIGWRRRSVKKLMIVEFVVCSILLDDLRDSDMEATSQDNCDG